MSVRGVLTNNVVIKLGCVALAIVVWNVIHQEITVEKTFNKIPVKINIPEDMVLVEKRFNTVKITLEGPRDILQNTTDESISLTHDLTYVKNTGAVIFNLSESDIVHPFRTRINYIRPEQARILLDRMIVKTLQVKPIIKGDLMVGYKIKKVRVNPEYLSVNGPEMKMNELSEIETLPVSILGRNRSFVQTVSLQPLVYETDAASLQEVEVSVEIERALQQTTFEKVSIFILSENTQSEQTIFVRPTELTLELQGTALALNDVDLEDIKVYVDVSGLGRGKYELPIIIMPLQDIEVLEALPNEVEVEIISDLEAS